MTTITHGVDALLLEDPLVTYNSDALLLKTQSNTYQADADLKKIQTKTHSVDALKLKTQTKTYSVDTLICASNNNFAQAITLTGEAGQVQGNNSYSTTEASEDNFGSFSVWYKWTAGASKWYQFNTIDGPTPVPN